MKHWYADNFCNSKRLEAFPVCRILKDARWLEKDEKFDGIKETRGPKGHISCTWVQCATFLRRTFLFTDRPKITTLVEDVEILLPVKFLWIPFSGFRGEVENVSANQRPRRPSCFSYQPEKHLLGRWCKILLPVKCQWIPFSRFRGEVENVWANHRPGRPSCFSDRPAKKIGTVRWDFASCQVSLISVQRFQWGSRKCLSQSEVRAAILFFRSARKTQTW